MSGAYAAAVVRDGDEAQEAFDFAVGETFEEVKETSANAVREALGKMGATVAPSGKQNVVFNGKQFRNFLAVFASAFSAKNAQLGLSLLAGKEGEEIAAPLVNIIDDPMREGSPIKTPFDGEGVATARRAIVEGGVLKTLLYDLTTAKKAGVTSTGNGQKGSYAAPVSIAPYNFGLVAGEDDLDTLLSKAGEGIYITECKGFHAGANAVTGDFSIESAGFMIRDGKLAEPVKSFTIAGNFFELIKNIDTLGVENSDYGSTVCESEPVKVCDFLCVTLVDNTAHSFRILNKSEYEATADSTVTGDNAFKLVALFGSDKVGDAFFCKGRCFDEGVCIEKLCNQFSSRGALGSGKLCMKLARGGEATDFRICVLVQIKSPSIFLLLINCQIGEKSNFHQIYYTTKLHLSQ